MALAFTMASFPTDWDSCQFVLGMNRFSPPDHQPHPPGYFFFIEIAKLIRVLNPVQIGNFTALLIAGLIGSALVVPAVRRLTLKLYPGRDNLAIGASLIVIGAPARLFFGAQGLSYGWECLFAVLLVSLALDQREKDSKIARIAWLGWIATYAIGGGFRPDLLLFFFPLGVILALKRTVKENIAAICIFCFLTASWFIPTAISSGGFFRYIESLRGHGSFFLWGGLGFDRLYDNATALYNTPAAITGVGIPVWIAILVLSYLIVLRSHKLTLKISPFARMVMIAYAIPLVLFHMFVFYTMRYSLLYVPLLIPLFIGIVWISLEPTNGPLPAINSAVIRQSVRGFGILAAAIILSISYYAFLNGTAIHSFKRITQLEKETRHVAGFVRELGDSDSVTIITGKQFRIWGIALSEYATYFPMHSLYGQEFNPRLAEMSNGDTIRGDFYLPGAMSSEEVSLPEQQGESGKIIVLDEKAREILKEPLDNWSEEKITSRENLYWCRFDGEIRIIDSEDGLRIISEPDNENNN